MLAAGLKDCCWMEACPTLLRKCPFLCKHLFLAFTFPLSPFFPTLISDYSSTCMHLVQSNITALISESLSHHHTLEFGVHNIVDITPCRIWYFTLKGLIPRDTCTAHTRDHVKRGKGIQSKTLEKKLKVLEPIIETHNRNQNWNRLAGSRTGFSEWFLNRRHQVLARILPVCILKSTDISHIYITKKMASNPSNM